MEKALLHIEKTGERDPITNNELMDYEIKGTRICLIGMLTSVMEHDKNIAFLFTTCVSMYLKRKGSNLEELGEFHRGTGH